MFHCNSIWPFFRSMIIGFNHNYYLRHDDKRTILASNPQAVEKGFIDEWFSRIHPLYAMFFALLSEPQKKEDAEQRIAVFFGTSLLKAQNLLEQFLKKESILAGDYGGHSSYFPGDVIRIYEEQEYLDYIKKSNRSNFTIYNPADFKFVDVDVETRRMIRCPHGLVFIVTTICATNCIYCYADKSTKCNRFLGIEEIERLLKEARDLGIKEIQMIGGEFFLHPDWEKILLISTELGFTHPLISTKLPLTKEQLTKFKEFNIRIQFSLDSINPDILTNTLCVGKSYSEQIIQTLELADKLNLKYKIATVLTRQTATIENLSALYQVFKKFKNLNIWTIRLAFRSLYTTHSFEEIKVTEDQFSQIHMWYERIKSDPNKFTIDFPEAFKTEYQYANNGSVNFKGARCSANMSHMVILPDGNVTICEQLYWNPRFIIGNILTDSIYQVWNSEKAMALSKWQQKDIQHKSACYSCSIYDTCRDFANKCFANTIKAYGDRNWDYPDPRCDLAPSFLNEIT